MEMQPYLSLQHKNHFFFKDFFQIMFFKGQKHVQRLFM
jgi:hypothetical protein